MKSITRGLRQRGGGGSAATRDRNPKQKPPELTGGTIGYLGLAPTRYTHHNFLVPAVQVSGEMLEAFSDGKYC